MASLGSSRFKKRWNSADSTVPELSSSSVIQSAFSFFSDSSDSLTFSLLRMPSLISANSRRPDKSTSRSLKRLNQFESSPPMTSFTFWLSSSETSFSSSLVNPPLRASTSLSVKVNCFMAVPTGGDSLTKRPNSTFWMQFLSFLSSAHHKAMINSSDQTAFFTLNVRRIAYRTSSYVRRPDASLQISLRTVSHATPWWMSGR